MFFIRWHVELFNLHWDLLSFIRIRKHMPTLRMNYILQITVECTLLIVSKTCPVFYLDDADAVVAVVVLSRDVLLKDNALVFLEFIQLNYLCKRA